MYVRPHVLDAHLRFLLRHFRIISFAEFLSLRDARAWDPGARYCLITFDDGWLDNYVHAYPILRRYDVPATIFVSSALVGSEEWMWPDKLGWLLTQSGAEGAAAIDSIIESCKRMSDRAIADLLIELSGRLGVELPKRRVFLQWSEIEEMSRGGIAFGSHGATHRLLPGLSTPDLRTEVAGSLQMLRRTGVNHVPVFCYPNGDHDDAVVELVRASGYRAAVSTAPGAEAWKTPDAFRLKRVAVHDDVSASLPLFAFHLWRAGQL
jgi:peptidoglycan/xylan/chitin deacetylase (PgdA/CDA1 family)